MLFINLSLLSDKMQVCRYPHQRTVLLEDAIGRIPKRTEHILSGDRRGHLDVHGSLYNSKVGLINEGPHTAL
jgi:hypothetical protein